MIFNLSDYFPASQQDLADFVALDGDEPDALPPPDGLSQLLAVKDALVRIQRCRQRKEFPSSIGQLVELVAAAFAVNRFHLASALNVDAVSWQRVIFNTSRPDTLPAQAYAVFAKRFLLPFDVISRAILGSFHLVASGGPISGAVYTRASNRSSYELAGAIEELIQKGASANDPSTDSKVQAFLGQVESCMK